jgi:hypothetical protein
MSDYRRGLDWWIEFIDDLSTQLVTTPNYSAIADRHTLQFTRAHTKTFHEAKAICIIVFLS